MQNQAKKVQDYSVEELKQIGFDLYQKRTSYSQAMNEINQQIGLINTELEARQQKPVEQPTEEKKAKK